VVEICVCRGRAYEGRVRTRGALPHLPHHDSLDNAHHPYGLMGGNAAGRNDRVDILPDASGAVVRRRGAISATRKSTIRVRGVAEFEDWTPEQPRTPWFLAMRPQGNGFEEYEAFAAVAVMSAMENAPSLEPHLLWVGGEKNNFTAWCENRGVVVHYFTTPVYKEAFDVMLASGEIKERRHAALMGAFGRIEIPRVYRAWGGRAEYLLYTDVDVMFFTDPGLMRFRVAKIGVGVGPQVSKNKVGNTGVLLFRVDRWMGVYPELVQFMELYKWRGRSFEQALLIRFFSRVRDFASLLPNTWNWKAYWGCHPNGRDAGQDIAIGHFHGPKPKMCLDDYLDGRNESCGHQLLHRLKATEKTFGLNCYRSWLSTFERFYDQAVPCKLPSESYSNMRPPFFQQGYLRVCPD